MKITITFGPDERADVMELVAAAKRIFRTSRYRESKQPKDGMLHVYLSSAKH